MRKFLVYSIIALSLSTVMLPNFSTPCQAESRRQAVQGADRSDEADLIKRQNYARAHAIFNDYLYKAQQLDKIDNDITYLIDKSSNLQGEELASYIETYIVPKNNELLRHASSITSSSSAIRELNTYFMNYAKQRMSAMHSLAQLARTKVPARYIHSFMSASCFGGSYMSSSEMFVGEQVPSWVRREMANMKSNLDAMFEARNNYLNRRAYIERNQDEVITEDEK